MLKRTLFQRLVLAGLATVLVFFFAKQPDLFGSVEAGPAGPDGIVIDLPSVPGGNEMPGVRFLHDRHTRQLQGNDCSACHLKDTDTVVFRFKRLKDTDIRTDMAIYHENCIGCHQEKKSAGQKSGPVEGQCRSCHAASPGTESSWQPLVFSRSLHFRHESSKVIASPVSGETTNCSKCHHRYDEAGKKLVMAAGTESSCLDCHKPVQEGDVRSIRKASHDSCVACHQSLRTQEKDAGPVSCLGCHDPAEQKKIKVLDTVPRLKRNQPDGVVLTGWDRSLTGDEAIRKAAGKAMKPVAFDHKAHEAATASCRECHHETLKGCRECHLDDPVKAGGSVSLDKAMHDKASARNCVGCHARVQAKPDCAGCHALMPEKTFEQNACTTCHAVAQDPVVLTSLDRDQRSLIALDAVTASVNAYAPANKKNVPETILLGAIANEYEPAQFPHAKMIKALEERIGASNMAKVFHGSKTAVCQGCHHNSPAAETPPGCGACHGKTVQGQKGRPGLKGAYHGQCISCHEAMNLEKIKATDCIKCHSKKK